MHGVYTFLSIPLTRRLYKNTGDDATNFFHLDHFHNAGLPRLYVRGNITDKVIVALWESYF